MVERPIFTLMAGGNGAGKSTVATEVLPKNTAYFNGDLVRAEIEKEYKAKYPNYSESYHIDGAVASKLEELTEYVVGKRLDFAFETNFSNDMAMMLVNKFKLADYNVSLVYVGLESLNQSVDRVNFRVAMGGHAITKKDIEFNLYEGIRRVNENMQYFDFITFIDNRAGEISTVALFYRNGNLKNIYDENVNWFTSNFKNSFHDL